MDYPLICNNVASPYRVSATSDDRSWLARARPISPVSIWANQPARSFKAQLRQAGLEMIAGVRYQRIADDGLHVTVGDQAKTLMVDHVILCAERESKRDLYAQLREREVPTHLIGGAENAGELDAMRAFEQATRLAT